MNEQSYVDQTSAQYLYMDFTVPCIQYPATDTQQTIDNNEKRAWNLIHFAWKECLENYILITFERKEFLEFEVIHIRSASFCADLPCYH